LGAGKSGQLIPLVCYENNSCLRTSLLGWGLKTAKHVFSPKTPPGKQGIAHCDDKTPFLVAK
jgi:hypothetical protein